MFEKFTERARKVMKLATQQANRLHSEFVGTEHILLAILDEEGGVAAKALRKLRLDQGNMRAEIERIIEPNTNMPAPTLGTIPYSPRAKRVIELAGEEACRAGVDVVGTEHILLGLYREHEGIAYQVLHNFGVKDQELRSCMKEILGPEGKSIAGGIRTEIPVKVKVSLFGEEHAGSSTHGLLVMGDRRLTLLQQVTVDGMPWKSREAIAAALARELGATAYLVEGQDTIRPMPG